MRSLSTLVLLLVASSMALVHAGPTDRFDKLSTRLAQLLSNPANKERYNVINRFESDEVYFPKREEQTVTRNKPKMSDAATQTSDEITEPTEKTETPEDLMAVMFKTMFKLMGEMMRGVFTRR
ncbi:uncharacterized protein [Eurosta solidaginis]|uniref:uncharacterized protein n=1 Tax=Eurosta solidaginis TaxID=178769 RepID=UPI0035311C94